MKTIRETVNSTTKDLLDLVVERIEHLLRYEDEKYPRERVFEEIRELLDDIG